MSNIIEYLKDKIYYILGGTVIFIIILIIIGACSNSGDYGSYEQIENNMTSAAKRYYETRKDRLPKEQNSTIKVSVDTLIDEGLLKNIKNPSDKSKSCSGYVEVTNLGEEYAYTPFLECEGYESKKLTDIIRESKLDEYGNGVYNMDGELVYRGDTVKNFVSFNNQLWRIIKVDKDGDIKIVLARPSEDYYEWDKAYNSEMEDYSGITTDYLHTNIRKILKEYYEKKFNNENKNKIVSKNLCVGKYDLEDAFSADKECSVTKTNEKVGLLVPTDYQKASLSNKCSILTSLDCTNYNYLSDENYIDTWLLNAFEKNTYEVLSLNKSISKSYANYSNSINPVIYINKNITVVKGNGTESEPFVIK